MSKEEKEKLVPNLRFKGFTDDWIQKKLSDLATHFDYGLNASAKKFDGKNKYLRITDIDEETRSFILTDLKSPSGNLEGKEEYLLEYGDITFARTGASVGKSYLHDRQIDNVYFAGFLIRIRPISESDSKFIFYNTLTSKYQNFVKVTSMRSGQPGINAKEFQSYKLYTPKNEEQEKIGNILKSIDNIITLEQEKLTHYQAMKKALSTSIFPRNNEPLPNLTFNGDSGWKQQKLENFLSIPDKIKVEVTDTDEILSVKLNTNGVVGGESRSTLKLGATAYYSRDSGQFIYGKQNFFNGAMAIIPENLDGKVSSGDIPSLNISGINPNFLYEYLSRPYYYKQTETMASGTGSKRIHEKTLLNFKIKVPNSNVQSNIEHLLASLSNLIDIQNNKVKKVEQAKAYLLNNLFV